MLFKKNNVMKSRGFKECPLAPYHIEQPFVDAFKQQKIYEQSIDDIKIFHFYPLIMTKHRVYTLYYSQSKLHNYFLLISELPQ